MKGSLRGHHTSLAITVRKFMSSHKQPTSLFIANMSECTDSSKSLTVRFRNPVKRNREVKIL